MASHAWKIWRVLAALGVGCSMRNAVALAGVARTGAGGAAAMVGDGSVMDLWEMKILVRSHGCDTAH